MSNLMEYVGLNPGLKGSNQAKIRRRMPLRTAKYFQITSQQTEMTDPTEWEVESS
jgi:hypothetical protein